VSLLNKQITVIRNLFYIYVTRHMAYRERDYWMGGHGRIVPPPLDPPLLVTSIYNSYASRNLYLYAALSTFSAFVALQSAFCSGSLPYTHAHTHLDLSPPTLRPSTE
jgi:hypothetical protein